MLDRKAMPPRIINPTKTMVTNAIFIIASEIWFTPHIEYTTYFVGRQDLLKNLGDFYADPLNLRNPAYAMPDMSLRNGETQQHGIVPRTIARISAIPSVVVGRGP
jgi:hypothetical protein